jgi:very-short-patch-repair endonuclease
MRLVNVAITRARGKVVVLADRNWLTANARREQNPLLWDLIADRPPAQRLPVEPPPTDGAARVESEIERLLFEAMGDHPQLQTVELQYRILDAEGAVVSRADFAFPGIRYAIYCDGAQWHLREARWHRDLSQRNKLTELGWTFSVYSGRDVKRDAPGCARQIAETLRQRLGDRP